MSLANRLRIVIVLCLVVLAVERTPSVSIVGLVDHVIAIFRPTPPEPPAPIPASGFRVLIVEETADRSKLPAGQLEILNANGIGSVREFCKRACAQVNGVPEFRVFDKDSKLDRESDMWKQLMAIGRDGTPWLVCGNGKTGYSGPLPQTPAETLTLLKKFCGPLPVSHDDRVQQINRVLSALEGT